MKPKDGLVSLPLRITTWLTVAIQVFTPLWPAWADGQTIKVTLPSPADERSDAMEPSQLLAKLEPTYPPSVTNSTLPGMDSRVLPTKPTDEQLFVYQCLAEPLVPIGRPTTLIENENLASALRSFTERKIVDDFSALTGFLERHPDSPWRVAVLGNLGYLYRHSGYFSKALDALEQAWNLGKGASKIRERNLVNWILGEFAELNGRLGRFERLDPLLKEIKGRHISGSSTEKIDGVVGALGIMRTTPHRAFMCGPLALKRIWSLTRSNSPVPKEIADADCTVKGTSLAQLDQIGKTVKLGYQMAYWSGKGTVPTPAVVHWKAGHFATLVNERDGMFTVQDSTFGGNYVMSRKAVQNEASGYFLIAAGRLPDGWEKIEAITGAEIWGKGPADIGNPRETRPCDKKVGGGCSDCKGMPQYSMHALLASLNIVDTPVGITPPRGPALDFTITYNQRDAGQPGSGTFGHSNLGPKWTFNWLSYITDRMQTPESSVDLYVSGGGFETYPISGGSFPDPQLKSRAKLVKTTVTATPINPTGIQYELTYPDGSKMIFGVPTSASSNRKFFLTNSVDAAGNRLNFTYLNDGTFRIQKVDNRTDPVTPSTATVTATLSYSGADNKVTGVTITTPSGGTRSATLEYNSSGYLSRVTDAAGMSSSFTYDPLSDFITAMTTPYGTTIFSKEKPDSANQYDRWLTATDPLGQKERVAYIYVAPIPSAEDVVPTSDIPFFNENLHWRNSFFWDKKAMQSSSSVDSLDYSTAKIMHWTHGETGYSASGILESEKLPLERRVWYRYGGQATGIDLPAGPNATASPVRVGRVLDSGTTQLYKYSYNELGHITSFTDPMGRTTSFEYEANKIDMKAVRQAVDSGSELLASFTYTSSHLPRTVTDAAGRITGFLYNSYGQVVTITNAKMEETTLNYNATSGFLESVVLPNDPVVSVPLANRTTTFTPDNVYRIYETTDGDGYKLTYKYDNLDRLTNVFYPDNTPGTLADNPTEAIFYNKLDPVLVKDRQGRWTSTSYDPLRRAVASRDSLGRTTFMDWCSCGALSSLIDAMGRSTIWERDLQGRVTKKILPDGSEHAYTYEITTSRLRSVKDPKGQTTTYDYHLDNNLETLSYQSFIPTPSVSLTFEKYYNRLESMVDGTGTTKYNYRSIVPFSTPPTSGELNAALGAGRVSTINSPLKNDTVGFGYDELGRVTTKTNGLDPNMAGTVETLVYDAFGRVKSAVNELGTFTYAFDAASGRPTTITLPNGLTTEFAYLPASAAANFLRLQRIWNKDGANNVSKFEYDYNADGQIKTMTRTTGTDPSTFYAYSYDSANQLYRAGLSNGVPSTVGSLIKEFVYGYDAAGNRISEYQSSPNTAYTARFNNVNEQLNRKAGEKNNFIGTATETAASRPVAVTVGGIPAKMSGANLESFDGYAVASSDNAVVPIQAWNKYGISAIKKYQVNSLTANGTDKTFYYDLNGNLIKAVSGTSTTIYDWDGADRLVAMERFTSGARAGRSEFTYDGLGRRKRIVEKDATGGITAFRQFVWCGTDICEERDSANTVTRRYYSQGMKIVSGANTGNYFYNRDHLGSIREMVDNSKVVRARYDYDPYGKRGANLITAGTPVEAEFGFTGHFYHAVSGLYLALFRAYDPESGRWINRDPLAESGGVNLYGYVGNDPINLVDPLGLDFVDWFARQDWIDTGSNFFAGWSDTLTAGATKYIREAAGYNDVINPCSGEYGAGEIFGTANAFLAGGSGAVGGALRMGGVRGGLTKSLTRGAKRFFSDSRTHNTIAKQYWKGSANGRHLHHWFKTQANGGTSAGYNLLELPGRLNSMMNGRGLLGNTLELGIRGAILGSIPSAIAAGAFWGSDKDKWKNSSGCGCE